MEKVELIKSTPRQMVEVLVVMGMMTTTPLKQSQGDLVLGLMENLEAVKGVVLFVFE